MVSLRKTARAHSCNEARQKSVRSCLRSSTMQESSVSSSCCEVIHLFSQKNTKMEPLEPFIQSAVVWGDRGLYVSSCPVPKVHKNHQSLGITKTTVWCKNRLVVQTQDGTASLWRPLQGAVHRGEEDRSRGLRQSFPCQTEGWRDVLCSKMYKGERGI